MTSRNNLRTITSEDSTPEFWKALAYKYILSYSTRRWKANFCLCLDCVVRLGRVMIPVLDRYKLACNHLLWALHYMKVYNGEDGSVPFTKVDPKTRRIKVNRVMRNLQGMRNPPFF